MNQSGLSDYFKSSALNKTLEELIKGRVDNLIGVSGTASNALAQINIKSVFDLAYSSVFRSAENICMITDSNSEFFRSKQLPSELFKDGVVTAAFETLGGLEIKSLRSITDASAQILANSLFVSSIRDLSLWPPYIAARIIVNNHFGLGLSENIDLETPQDLVPKTGEYPVEVIYYNSVVLAEAPQADHSTKLEDHGSIDVNFNNPKLGFQKPGWGVILNFKQEWFAEGITLGNLIKSVPLAPGETTKIAVIDWQRTSSGSTAEDISQTERLSNDMQQKRAINEIAEATATEMQSGNSRTSAVGNTSNVGVGGGALLPGIPALVGGTASNSDTRSRSKSFSTSKGEKEVSSSMQQNIDNSTHQNSFSARNKRASVVAEVSETQTETITTRSVTNYNHMHALTVQYWQVVQIFRTEVKLEKYQRLLFIPMKPFDFSRDENIITRFKSTLVQAAHSAYVRELILSSIGNVSFEIEAKNKGEALEKDPSITENKEKLKEAKRIAKAIAKASMTEQARLNTYGRNGHILDYDKNSRSWKMPGTYQLINIKWSSEQNPQVNSVIIDVEDGESIIVSQNGPSYNSNALHPDLGGPVLLSRIEGISVKLVTMPDKNTVHKLELKIDTGGGRFANMTFEFMVRKDRDTELVLDVNPPQRANELGAALNEQALYYSQQIWLNLDQHYLTLLLSEFTYRNKRVVEYIDPMPVTVAGNCLGFIWHDKEQGDAAWQQWIKDNIDDKKTTYQKIALPTDGVFAEAVLGRFNAAEKLDITRFWNWQDSPIPFSAPDIAAIQSGQQQTGSAPATGSLESPVINIMNPPSMPDPTGMQAVNNSLGANIFRDMSGLAQSAALAQAALNASAQGATAAGSQAGANMATFANYQVEMAKILASLAPMLMGLPPMPVPGGKNISNAGAALNAAQSIDAGGNTSGGSSSPGSTSGSGGSSNSGGGSGGNSTNSNGGNTNRAGSTMMASRRGETGNVMDMITGNRNITSINDNGTQNAQNASDAELGNANLPSNIQDWSVVFNHTVPQNIITALSARHFAVQTFESSPLKAALNLDLYEVSIPTMPRKADGSLYSVSELYTELRISFADFISPAGITFQPQDAEDNIQWQSNHYLGAVMRFDTGLDDMGVVASKADSLNWTFSTIGDTNVIPLINNGVGNHPVSGNRMFGLYINSDGVTTFFTRGADRTSGRIETQLNETVFQKGDELWRKVQQSIKYFVEANSGIAVIQEPFSQRFNYRLSKEKLKLTGI